MRRIKSDDPAATAEDFYRRISRGGSETPIASSDGKGTKGIVAKMADGAYITYRPVSSSPDKSPAISIDVSKSSNSSGIKTHKIHFVKRVRDEEDAGD